MQVLKNRVCFFVLSKWARFKDMTPIESPCILSSFLHWLLFHLHSATKFESTFRAKCILSNSMNNTNTIWNIEQVLYPSEIFFLPQHRAFYFSLTDRPISRENFKPKCTTCFYRLERNKMKNWKCYSVGVVWWKRTGGAQSGRIIDERVSESVSILIKLLRFMWFFYNLILCLPWCILVNCHCVLWKSKRIEEGWFLQSVCKKIHKK